MTKRSERYWDYQNDLPWRAAKKGLIPILLLSLVTLDLFAQSDRGIGRLYLEEAAAAYLRGDVNNTILLAEEALGFDETLTDAHFLLGVIAEEINNDIDRAIQKYYLSLTMTGSIGSLGEKISRLSRLLHRTKKYRELSILIEQYQDRISLTQETIFFWGDGLLRSGNGLGFEVLSEGLRRYSDFLEFYIPLVRLEHVISTDAFASLLNLDRLGKAEIPLIEELLVALKDSEKLELIALTKEFNLSSPIIYLEESNLDGDISEDEVEHLVELGLLKDGFAFIRLIELLGPEEAAAVSDSFTGERLGDFDRDGFAEIRELWREGELVSQAVDPDQNGIFDRRIELQSWQPVRLEISEEYRSWIIEYAVYPRVKMIELFHDSGRVLFETTTTAMYLPIANLTDTSIISEPIVPDTFEIVLWDLATISDRILLFDMVGELVATGSPTSSGLIELVGETGDGGVVKMTFEAEKISGVWRDIDMDGIYELEEWYTDGKPARLVYHILGDSTYQISFDTGMEYWDMDGDGEIDMISSFTNQNREFSNFYPSFFSIFQKSLGNNLP